jgi:hypothetical protein
VTRAAVAPGPPKESEPAGVAERPQEPEPVVVAEPLGVIGPTSDSSARRRRFARLFGFLRAPRPEPAATDEPVPVGGSVAGETLPSEAAPETPAPETPATEIPATGTPATEAALTAALASLGQAHHRPYSRA